MATNTDPTYSDKTQRMSAHAATMGFVFTAVLLAFGVGFNLNGDTVISVVFGAGGLVGLGVTANLARLYLKTRG